MGVQHYFNQEAERSSQSVLPASNNPVLIDPIDKLCDLAATRDISVDDLVQALTPTKEEVELIQCMSIGHRNNFLWLDARQWRVTLNNFGKVCNRLSSQTYPPSLVKSLLGDYGYPHTVALQWGCDHEADAIHQYTIFTGS